MSVKVQNWERRIIEARQVTIFHYAFQPYFPELETGELILSSYRSKLSRGRVEILVGNMGEIK